MSPRCFRLSSARACCPAKPPPSAAQPASLANGASSQSNPSGALRRDRAGEIDMVPGTPATYSLAVARARPGLDPTEAVTFKRYNINSLRRALADRAAELARALLGEPSYRSRTEVRWGRCGRLSLCIAGPKRGLWHCNEIGTCGDLIALYRRTRGGTFPGRPTMALSATGERPPSPPRRPQSRVLSHHRAVARHPQSRRPSATRKRRAGTVAHRARGHRWYDTERYPGSRGIDPHRLPPHPNADPRAFAHDGFEYAINRWPPGLCWHAARRLLVILANDAGIELVRAVQTVALKPDGTPITDANGKKLKRTLGNIQDCTARFGWHPDPKGRWAITEGPESALAAAQMLGLLTWASLDASSLPHVRSLSWAHAAIIAADHDEAGIHAAEEAPAATANSD